MSCHIKATLEHCSAVSTPSGVSTNILDNYDVSSHTGSKRVSISSIQEIVLT
jgi:hypothetical protein